MNDVGERKATVKNFNASRYFIINPVNEFANL